LALAPLSLVQAASAGGIGLLGLLVWRSGTPPAKREVVGVTLALCGLILLGLSLIGTHAGHSRGSPAAVIAWLAGSALAATVFVAVKPRFLALGAGLGLSAGILYAAGDVATKAAVAGGAAIAFAAAVLSFHGVAFVSLQLGFQRCGALATAGVADPVHERPSDRSGDHDLPRGRACGFRGRGTGPCVRHRGARGGSVGQGRYGDGNGRGQRRSCRWSCRSRQGNGVKCLEWSTTTA
jgi:hypothetical protein